MPNSQSYHTVKFIALHCFSYLFPCCSFRIQLQVENLIFSICCRNLQHSIQHSSSNFYIFDYTNFSGESIKTYHHNISIVFKLKFVNSAQSYSLGKQEQNASASYWELQTLTSHQAIASAVSQNLFFDMIEGQLREFLGWIWVWGYLEPTSINSRLANRGPN